MTVIAYDGKTLAADRRITSSGLIRTMTKIRRIGDLRVGCAGPTDSAVAMFAWIEGGCVSDQFPKSQSDKEDWAATIVIDGAGRICMYERTPSMQVLEDEIIAIGSGRDFALAAMHLGKTAAEAVDVAAHFQCDCGNGVDVLDP